MREAEVGGIEMQLQAKESLELPEAGRDKEGSSLTNLEGNVALPTYYFRLGASRTLRPNISVVLGKPPS